MVAFGQKIGAKLRRSGGMAKEKRVFHSLGKRNCRLYACANTIIIYNEGQRKPISPFARVIREEPPLLRLFIGIPSAFLLYTSYVCAIYLLYISYLK